MSAGARRPSWTWEIPEYFNIGAACTDAHLDTPVADRVAMIVEDERLGTSTATFAELVSRTGRFAQVLRNLDVRPRFRVLMRLPNSLDFPAAFLGAMKVGAISVPTSTLLVAEEVRYLAEDSGASVLVTHKSMWPELQGELARVQGLQHVILAGSGVLPAGRGAVRLHDLDAELAAIDDWEDNHPTRSEDPAYLVYTSGTTGHPKGVLHAHRALLGREPAMKHWFDFKPGDRVLHSGKFNWTYVLGTGLMDPLYNGKTVVVYEGHNDAGTWPRLIAGHACTIFIGVPSVYRQIIQKTEYSRADVPTLRHCMSAGEHLSDEMLAAWRERFGRDIYEGLGMSEVSYYISQKKGRPIRPGAAGFIQPGHQAQLLDADLKPVPDGQEGMICIPADDPGLFLGYWNLEEETAKVRRQGWFLTGDYARKDEDGYIWFLGRRDDIINSFGYRVSPHEVERVMKTHPEVADCVAIGEEVDKDKILVVVCVILKPAASAGADELLAYGREHLAGYKCPKKVHLVKDYPRTKNGKVIRRELKEDIETKARRAFEQE